MSGIWPVDAATYHADSSRVSNSMLKVFAESIPKFHQRFVTSEKPAPEPSKEMVLGSLLHQQVLEPHRSGDFVIAPTVAKTSNVGKEIHATFAAENAGKTIITNEQWELATAMNFALWRHPVVCEILAAQGQNELSILWDDHETGIALKARLDGWRPEQQILFDIKTSREPDEQSFNIDAYKLGYHRQAALYIDGALKALDADVSRLRFFFLVVGSSPPHEVGVYELAPQLLQLGADENAVLLQELSERRVSDDWSGRTCNYEIPQLTGPAWAYNRQPFERRVFEVGK